MRPAPSEPARQAATVPRARRGAVTVDRLTWRPYGRREPVLREVSLTIPAGQRVLLVGPSGSGKSTLLRALAGLLETADTGERSGTVLVDGEEPGSRAGMVGLVLQEPGAGVVAASVERDVAFGLENTAVPRAVMPGRVREALAAVRLDLPESTPTNALSGGQTQRLAVAGALALNPSVLLLDEPTAMLDPENAAAVRESVAEVADAYAMTTIVAEHLLEPWLPVVDRVVALGSDGCVVADGPPEAVLREHAGMLAAQGLWVPGVAAPEPLRLPEGLLARPVGEGAPVWATGVVVERTASLADGSTRTTRALDGVDVDGVAAHVTALVGPSGSGKSTLVLVLAGLLEPSAGQATPGHLPSLDLARRLAWVPQWSSSTLVARTVLDEVLVTSRALGLPDEQARPRAVALLAAVGLDGMAAADPRRLSGGEQRRLAVVSAVAHGPRAVLADEPTVGQDRHTWAAVVGLLDAYAAAGGAVVVATHDAGVITRADDVLHLVAPEQPPTRPVRRSLVGRCGPLSLLLGSLLGIPAAVLSPRWTWSLVVIAVQLLLGGVGLLAPGPGIPPGRRVRRLLARLVPGFIAAVSVGWSTWLLGGHSVDRALTGVLRILVLVLPSAVLVPFVDPDALGDHVAQRLHGPARPVVATSAALQRVHAFGDTWTEISRSRRVRGLGGHGLRSVLSGAWASTFGLVVRALGEAAALSVAMDARGFASAYRRTWWAPACWRTADTVLVVVACIPVLVALLAP